MPRLRIHRLWNKSTRTSTYDAQQHNRLQAPQCSTSHSFALFLPLQNVMDRMSVVEKRVAAEAKQVDGPVGGADLREYQTQLLLKLRAIRDTMQKEGSSLEQLRKERDEARSERDTLKKQVDKLNYRVLHLKQHVPEPTPADMKL
ncbi:hypothetical protein PHYPSEUDO_004094 [Phytophthora pseudosyringae]|uniref:Uncharacterized protein n=1 Tax=Phytophthora pseudosyringae TaxID=221518 RepID=A0A8T1WBZ5_9STRA|nr:hypothetical protein PHYPSEUDO_004094 [Phytophthora pseudosyringae]